MIEFLLSMFLVCFLLGVGYHVFVVLFYLVYKCENGRMSFSEYIRLL